MLVTSVQSLQLPSLAQERSFSYVSHTLRTHVDSHKTEGFVMVCTMVWMGCSPYWQYFGTTKSRRASSVSYRPV